MEEKIRDIISQYTKIPAEQISAQTVIDRSVVASSIILHRMYAILAAEGIIVENYVDIKTYGQLVAAFDGKAGKETAVMPPQFYRAGQADDEISAGIDIEEVSSMPVVADYREDEFYKINFSPAEIAYCILQQNPPASFAGLFAAKEAIIKADNSYKKYPFSEIQIEHLTNGRPVYQQFNISISHTDQYAVAMAVPKKNEQMPQPLPSNPQGPASTNLLSILAFLFSLLALIVAFFLN